MSCKFNNGRGAHTCDRCSIMLCEGTLDTPRLLRYPFKKTAGPHQHWVAPRTNLHDTTGSDDSNDSSSSNWPDPWKHSAEYCSECAVLVQIDREVNLITAKELYNL